MKAISRPELLATVDAAVEIELEPADVAGWRESDLSLADLAVLLPKEKHAVPPTALLGRPVCANELAETRSFWSAPYTSRCCTWCALASTCPEGRPEHAWAAGVPTV